jgi:hypothetical protein
VIVELNIASTCGEVTEVTRLTSADVDFLYSVGKVDKDSAR